MYDLFHPWYQYRLWKQIHLHDMLLVSKTTAQTAGQYGSLQLLTTLSSVADFVQEPANVLTG
jgi:hypothetical protein